VAEYEALNEEYDNALDAQQKAILQRRIIEMEVELKALDQRLDQGKEPSVLDKLHYIDFKKPVEEFKQLLESWGRQGGSSVLVLQDSSAMGGDLLIRRLQEELRNQSSKFRYLPVGFSEDNNLDELGLLRRLSNHLGVEGGSGNLDETLDAVLEKLCASICTRSVVLVEISQWHKLPSQSQVFSWICTEFYPQLAAKLSRIVSEKSWRKVYIFLVIISDDLFPVECTKVVNILGACEENSSENICEGIFQVCLENWSKDDIEDWLEFTGLPDDKLDSTAMRLFARSRQGIPLLVRDSIEKEFSND
jgi:hypothetical protein